MGVRESLRCAPGRRGVTARMRRSLAALGAPAAARRGLARLQGAALQRAEEAAARPPVPRGVYLWGGVGRGKSFLMDAFFAAVPVLRKTRLHFHEFMRSVHRRTATNVKGTPDPLDEVAQPHRAAASPDLLRRVPRLRHRRRDDPVPPAVEAVRAERRAGDDVELRARSRSIRTACTGTALLPAIALLKERLDVVHVDAGIDYRRRAMEHIEAYLTPWGAAAERSWRRRSSGLPKSTTRIRVLEIEARRIRARRRAGGRGLVRLRRAVRRSALA